MNITWPMVALGGLFLGAFVAIFWLIPDTDATSRATLLSAVTLCASAVVTVVQQRGNTALRSELEELKRELQTVARQTR